MISWMVAVGCIVDVRERESSGVTFVAELDHVRIKGS